MKKRLSSLFLAIASVLIMTPATFATTVTAPETAAAVVVAETENDEVVTVKEYNLNNGMKVVETEKTSRVSGVTYKDTEQQVYDGSTLVVTIQVGGSFNYDGDKATVRSRYQRYTGLKTGYAVSKFIIDESDQSGFRKAYISVDYAITKQSTGKVIGSGTTKVTCAADGT